MPSTSLADETHSEAIYTSRLLDNISSMEIFR